MILSDDPKDATYVGMQRLVVHLLERLGGRVRVPYEYLVETDWSNKYIAISDDRVTDSWIVKIVTREDVLNGHLQ